MAAYIHGNLAVQEKNKRNPYVMKKTTKKAAIPSSEKLLYLFTILIFVVVSGILLSRVSESYENSYKIQEVQSQIESIKEDLTLYQLEIDRLRAPERIIGIATERGMIQSGSPVHVNEKNQQVETASR